jgi:hypothetical protein
VRWSILHRLNRTVVIKCGKTPEPEIKLVMKNDIKEGAVDLQTAIVVNET